VQVDVGSGSASSAESGPPTRPAVTAAAPAPRRARRSRSPFPAAISEGTGSNDRSPTIEIFDLARDFGLERREIAAGLGPASTTLADLLMPLLAANPFSTMRASLRR